MNQDMGAHERPVPTAALLPFTLITFAISWGILGLYIFFPDAAGGWFGEIIGRHSAFVLAVWAPAIAAFAVVLYCGGVQGVAAYLSRLGLWRCPPGWVAFLLLALFHFQVNNPLWPDAQPYDTYFFVAVAVLVVWLNRRTMFTREGAVTEVIASTDRARGAP